MDTASGRGLVAISGLSISWSINVPVVEFRFGACMVCAC